MSFILSEYGKMEKCQYLFQSFPLGVDLFDGANTASLFHYHLLEKVSTTIFVHIQKPVFHNV